MIYFRVYDDVVGVIARERLNRFRVLRSAVKYFEVEGKQDESFLYSLIRFSDVRLVFKITRLRRVVFCSPVDQPMFNFIQSPLCQIGDELQRA